MGASPWQDLGFQELEKRVTKNQQVCCSVNLYYKSVTEPKTFTTRDHSQNLSLHHPVLPGPQEPLTASLSPRGSLFL